MIQLGFFDFDTRLDHIDKTGDPLVKLNGAIDWELSRPTLKKARDKAKKSPAGAQGYDVILLFKILILQSLYNLADEAMEYQILDRYSFSRFLGLHAASKVPDATTIWRFRDDLSKAEAIDSLFAQFDRFLHEQGFKAQKGQIIDASIVRVPANATIGKKTSRSRRASNRQAGRKTRSARKIPMPAGPRRTARVSLGTRTISQWT